MSRKKQLEDREKHWYEGTGPSSETRTMQRNYEEEQRNASSLNPVRSKWTNPPPQDMMRPRSAQRLRDAQDRDTSLNQSYAARPGARSAPEGRKETNQHGRN